MNFLKRNKNKFARAGAVLSLAALVAACGGSGDSPDNYMSVPANKPDKTVEAGPKYKNTYTGSSEVAGRIAVSGQWYPFFFLGVDNSQFEKPTVLSDVTIWIGNHNTEHRGFLPCDITTNDRGGAIINSYGSDEPYELRIEENTDAMVDGTKRLIQTVKNAKVVDSVWFFGGNEISIYDHLNGIPYDKFDESMLTDMYDDAAAILEEAAAVCA